MTNSDYEKLKELSKSMSVLRDEQINAISKVAKTLNESPRMKAYERLSNSLLVASAQFDVSRYEPLYKSLVELSKVTSSPSFLNTMNELKKVGNALVNTMQVYYDSPSYRAMIEAFSNMDTHSWQSFVDTVPEDISSNINDIEQEIESDPETKANFQPYMESIEEVLSSHVGAKIDLSKSKLTITGLKILIHLIITLVGIYGPQILLPDPTDDLVEETKRHNIVEEQYQRDDLELKQIQIKIDQEQVKVNKQILSELKKSNEQKKDSK
ncbi:hypothetical protein PTQ21_12320 [Paenibacillus marchantiae]|uniref:hypothetical protein n=1 Tax=Paenibacillus marchantiae TaxID=3026433 RepID=UPI00237A3D1D|nr:hypothetical protein [Paenibacillus marchantiae]WDQ34973.1 hypothetical protein PTQ21_12320 [Paenibacillus marchantiae]